jgi:hypothetical protein
LVIVDFGGVWLRLLGANCLCRLCRFVISGFF